MLNRFMFFSLMLDFVFRFMFNFSFGFMLDFMLSLGVNLMLLLMLFFLELSIGFFEFLLVSFFRFSGGFLSSILFLSLFLFMLIFIVVSGMVSLGLLELSWYVANSSPFLSMLLLLSTHLNEESSCEDFLIRRVFDEVDSVNPGFKDDFERSRVVFLDFDEGEIGKCFFNILFNGIKVTFNEVEGDVLDILRKILDLLDKFLFLWNHELFLLLHFVHPQSIK